MIQRRILVCCGTGIATSVQVSKKIEALLKERGIRAQCTECKAIEVPAKIAAFKPDAVVSTTQINTSKITVPFFPGLPFLTGVGIAAAADKLAEALKEGEKP